MERFRLVMVFAVLVAGIHISVNAQKKNVTIEKVAFECNKSTLFGNLYIPANYEEGKQYPAIIMVSPATGIKEQVAGTYAERLAERGFIALAFDH